jgi:hypothetical protein
MSDELKPCPFCGNVPELGEHNVDQSSWKPRYDVACRNDKCILQRTYETQAVAVAAWNTRPIEDELLEKLQQLRAQWESVPWDAIQRCASDSFTHHDPARNAASVFAWLEANAPKPEKAK